jgi:DNA topoisomerase-1
MTKNKLISIILKIIFYCNFRIGGMKYEKLYNTIGISNVKVKHIRLLENSKINIGFIGKKKVLNTCTIDDAVLHSNISKLISNKNEESNVFQHSGINISEIDVNKFLKQYNPEFSTKMLRTMNANVYLIDSINKNYTEILLSDIKRRKKYIVSIIKDIAKDINNTPAVAKKNYINNDIIDMFLNNPKKYKKYFINKNNSVSNLINFLIKF